MDDRPGAAPGPRAGAWRRRFTPASITAAYVVVASAWLIASDVIAHGGSAEHVGDLAHVLPGLAFVAVTGVGVWLGSGVLAARGRERAATFRERSDLLDEVVRRGTTDFYRARITPDEMFTLEFWTPGFESIVGRRPSPDEYPKPLVATLEAYRPEDRRWILERCRDAVATLEPLVYTAPLRRPDGTERWINLRLAPSREDDGSVSLVGVVRDATADVESETDRPRLQRRSTTLDDISRLGLVEHFRGRFTVDERYALEDCSEGFGRLLGREVHPGAEPEPLGDALLDHHPDRRDAVREAVLRAVAEQEPAEFLSRTASDPPRWVRYRATPDRLRSGDTLLHGIAWDVTGEIEGERDRARLRERSEILEEAGRQGLFEHYRAVVTPDGLFRVESCSEGFEALVGAARAHTGAAAPIDEVMASLHEDDREPVRAELLRAMEALDEFEVVTRVDDGRDDDGPRYVRFRSRPVREVDGRISFRGIAYDVTERVRSEEERRRLRVDLAAARAPVVAMLRASVELERAGDEATVIRVVADAVREAGWGSVAVNLFDGDWSITHQAYAGMSEDRVAALRAARVAPGARAAMFGPSRDPFRVGRCYFIPEERRAEAGNVGRGIVSSRPPAEGDSWRPADLVYIPMRDPSGSVVGRITVDDPVDGQRPTAETLRYFELFADLAGRAVNELRLRRALEREQRAMVLQAEVLARMSDAVFWIDAGARFAWVNDRACQMLGYDRDTLLTMTVHDIDDAADADWWRGHWREIQRTGRVVLESTVTARDGRRIPVEILTNYIEVRGESFDCAFVRDISDRRGREDALRRSQNLSRQTERTARVGGWEYEVDPPALYWSEETFRIHELDPSHGVPSVDDAIAYYAPGWSRDRIQGVFEQALGTGEGFDEELELVTARGRRIWVRAQGEPEIAGGRVVRVAGAFQDITARKRAERALARQAMELRTIVDTAGSGIVLIDGEGRLIRCNRAMETMLGYTFEELRALGGMRAIAHPDDADATSGLTSDLLQGRRDRGMFEARYVRKDERVIWARVTASRATGPDGAPFVVSIVEDVTERRRVRDELRRVVEVRGLLLSELDHRVKNALAGLISMIDLTRERSESVDALASSIRERVETMARVHTMLTSSKWRSVPLDDLVGGVSPPGVGRRLNLEGPAVDIPARQATPMGMVLHELASNSLKHGAWSDERGRVDVRWSLEPEADEPEDPRRRLRLRWTERGGPPVGVPGDQGLGLSLIEGFASFELRGGVRFGFERDGASHELTVRLDDPAASEEEAHAGWLEVALAPIEGEDLDP
jgi:PAS domain S-box-containing protein